MLAQNFLSAEELGLEGREHQALVAVLGKLERGELRHVGRFYDRPKTETKDAIWFDMRWWNEEVDCGTVHCIGGAADAILGNEVMDSRSELLANGGDSSLHQLFYPEHFGTNLRDITAEQAAAALRNYLTIHDPCWEELLKGREGHVQLG